MNGLVARAFGRLAAPAVLGLHLAATAQSVTVCGIVDLAVERVDAVAPRVARTAVCPA